MAAKGQPKRVAGLAALADRLGVLDRMNVVTIVDGLAGARLTETPSTIAAIRFALAATAMAITEGRIEDIRPPGF